MIKISNTVRTGLNNVSTFEKIEKKIEEYSKKCLERDIQDTLKRIDEYSKLSPEQQAVERSKAELYYTIRHYTFFPHEIPVVRSLIEKLKGVAQKLF